MAVAIWLNQLNILAVLISNGKWSVDWSYARGTGHLRGCDFSGRPVQEELCAEAMRLCGLLAQHPACATPRTLALLSLMCFHAARLPGRVSFTGDFQR